MDWKSSESKAYSGTNQPDDTTETFDLVDSGGNVLKRYSKSAVGELSEETAVYVAPVARVVTGSISTALSGTPALLKFGNLWITTVAEGDGIPDDDDGTELFPYLEANKHLIPADSVVDNEDLSVTITMHPGANTLGFSSADLALTFAQDVAGADSSNDLSASVHDAVLEDPVLNDATLNDPVISDPSSSSTGVMITKRVAFTENATNTVHTGTVAIPAGAWLHEIAITSSVLWTGGTASMDVGDTADPNGYFDTINLKATDLLVGEVLSTNVEESWGATQGAYLVAATGQRGPAVANFGKYYAAGSNIVGVVTVGTPATTAGRTFMHVTYSVGTVIPAVVSGP